MARYSSVQENGKKLCRSDLIGTNPLSDIIIAVEDLSKRYLVGHQSAQRGYITLRDMIGREARNFARKAVDFIHGRQIVQGDDVEEFWALKDVSFEVKRGEVLGIIGRNGAGKSTLLKILSRITEPDGGQAILRGRVASLLEVGTGFHPELTGRENIFLNGAILGMTRVEIERKFDEIVAFAEVERFLDTPVKHYSSGMYVRLAFAIAAHLEPEILIVDEVLAVGDAEFQRKCLGRLRDVSQSGRAVLFVSHNMSAVQALCSKAMLLNSGRIQLVGSPAAVLTAYAHAERKHLTYRRAPRNDGTPTITIFQIDTVSCEEAAMIKGVIEITSQRSTQSSLEIKLQDEFGTPIGLASVGLLNTDDTLRLAIGRNIFSFQIELPRLARGRYGMTAQLAIPMVEIIDAMSEEIVFSVEPRLGDGAIRVLESSWGYGALEVPLRLTVFEKKVPSLLSATNI